jgi:trehalose 6-phosphate phosphatase
MRELKPLFGEEGLRSLGAAIRARPLMAFDFDGTLAPLVPRPEDAQVPAALAGCLRRLAGHLPLAIVTGRSVGDVTGRLGFPATFIVGNHGAEERGVVLAVDLAPLDIVRARIDNAAGVLRAAGIRVEDKQYSLALHYRQAVNRDDALVMIDTLLYGLPPTLQIVPGRMVRNVVLTDAPDKGDAVASLVRRANCSLAVFVGDDVNDEAVFTSAPENWLTVRVGDDFPMTRARYFLDSYADVARLFEKVLAELEAG